MMPIRRGDLSRLPLINPRVQPRGRRVDPDTPQHPIWLVNHLLDRGVVSGGGGGPVTPPREFTDEELVFDPLGVYEVWDSETGVEINDPDEDQVTDWTGLVRNLNLQPDLSSRPIYRTEGTGLNGHRYVDFIYHARNQLSVLFGETLPQPLTVLMVFTWVDFDFSAGIWQGISPGGFPDQCSFGLSSGNVILVAGSVGINCNGGGGWAAGASHMMVNICDAGNNDARTYRGGVLFGSGNPAGAHVLEGFRLARFFGPALSHNLHVYRVAILTYRPTDEELNAWWTLMGARYDLPFTPLP